MSCVPLADGIFTGEYAVPPPNSYAPFGFVPKIVESRLTRISVPHLNVCDPRTQRHVLLELIEIAVRSENRSRGLVVGLEQPVSKPNSGLRVIRLSEKMACCECSSVKYPKSDAEKSSAYSSRPRCAGDRRTARRSQD